MRHPANCVNGHAHGRSGVTMFWETMNLLLLFIFCQMHWCNFFILLFASLPYKLTVGVWILSFPFMSSLSSESKSKNYITANTEPFVFLEEMPSNIRNIMLPGKQVLLWDSVFLRDPLSAFCCHFLCNKENLKKWFFCNLHCNVQHPSVTHQ